jgi:hypothetical protein
MCRRHPLKERHKEGFLHDFFCTFVAQFEMGGLTPLLIS